MISNASACSWRGTLFCQRSGTCKHVAGLVEEPELGKKPWTAVVPHEAQLLSYRHFVLDSCAQSTMRDPPTKPLRCRLRPHDVQLLRDLLIEGAGHGQFGMDQQLASYKNTSGFVEVSSALHMSYGERNNATKGIARCPSQTTSLKNVNES